MKNVKLFSFFLVALLLGLSLSSCKDDKDEPAKSLDKINGLQSLTGTWIADDGSNAYFLVVMKNEPNIFNMNRMICYWNGTLKDMGVPVFSLDGDQYYTWGTTLEIRITAYDAKAGKMTVYNTRERQTKNFRLASKGNMAIIKNPETYAYKNIAISVYSEDNPTTPIYSTNIGDIPLRNTSVPFWTGGGRAIVKAIMKNEKTGETETATWDELNANTFYVLNL